MSTSTVPNTAKLEEVAQILLDSGYLLSALELHQVTYRKNYCEKKNCFHTEYRNYWRMELKYLRWKKDLMRNQMLLKNRTHLKLVKLQRFHQLRKVIIMMGYDLFIIGINQPRFSPSTQYHSFTSINWWLISSDLFCFIS